MLPLLNNLVGIFWMRFASAHVYLLTQMVPSSPPPPFSYVSVSGIVCGWSGGHSGNYFSLLHNNILYNLRLPVLLQLRDPNSDFNNVLLKKGVKCCLYITFLDAANFTCTCQWVTDKYTLVEVQQQWPSELDKYHMTP